jgi:hypothetical protein
VRFAADVVDDDLKGQGLSRFKAMPQSDRRPTMVDPETAGSIEGRGGKSDMTKLRLRIDISD